MSHHDPDTDRSLEHPRRTAALRHIKSFFLNDFPRLVVTFLVATLIVATGWKLANTEAVRNAEVTASGLVFIVGLVLAVRFLVRHTWRGRQWGTVALHGSAASALGSARPGGAVAMRVEVKRPAEDLARHEAAHAVVAYALGHRVTQASIVVDGLNGGVTTTDLSDTPLKYLDQIALTYAGPLAEGTGDVLPSVPGHNDDYTALMRLALAASITDPHSRTPGELFDEGTRMARELVVAHEDAIAAVAEALLDTNRERALTEDEVTTLMQRHNVRHDTTDN